MLRELLKVTLTPVLLINTAQWAAQQVSARAIAMLNEPEIIKITHPDQDVLNMLLADKLIFADIKYNTQFSLNYQLKESFINPVTNDTILSIISGQPSPGMIGRWELSCITSLYGGKNASPWKNTALLKPNNSNQLRYSAKHMLKSIDI